MARLSMISTARTNSTHRCRARLLFPAILGLFLAGFLCATCGGSGQTISCTERSLDGFCMGGPPCDFSAMKQRSCGLCSGLPEVDRCGSLNRVCGNYYDANTGQLVAVEYYDPELQADRCWGPSTFTIPPEAECNVVQACGMDAGNDGPTCAQLAMNCALCVDDQIRQACLMTVAQQNDGVCRGEWQEIVNYCLGTKDAGAGGAG